MAILYELLTRGRPRPRSSRGRPRDVATRPRSRSRRDADPGRSPPSTGGARAARAATWSSGAPPCSIPGPGIDGVHDVVVRDGEIAELAEPGRRRGRRRRGDRGRGPARLPGLLRPPRPPAHARATRTRRTSRPAPAPPPPAATAAILAMANTEPPVDTAADVLALREQAAEQASVPVGFLATVTRGMEGEELTEMAELRDAGAVGFSDDGLPIANARRHAPRAPVPAPRRRHDRPARGGPRALRRDAASMHEGAVSAALGLAGIPSVSESTMIARDAALAAYEDARIHVQHLSARESVEAVAAREGGRRADHLRGDAAPPDAHRRGGPQPRLPLQDEPAAARRGRPPGADRGASLRASSTASPPTTRRTRPRRRRSRSRRRRWASPASRPPSRRSTPSWCCPGVLDLGLLVERHERRRRAVRPRAAAASRPGAEANVGLFDLEAEWEAGEDGWESRSDNSCFAGRRMLRPRPDDGRRRPGRLPPARASRWGSRERRRSSTASGPTLVVIDVQEAFRKAVPELRRGSPRRRRPWSAGAEAIGVPIVVTEQYPKGLGRTVAGGRRAPAGGHRAAREGLLLGRRRPRASTSAAATRRSSAGSRRTSASTRPSSTCSTRGSRCTSPSTRSARASTQNRELGLREDRGAPEP